MDRSLYIMASGMLTELARQDRIANDLANASTPGYKRTVATQHAFGDILLESRRTGQLVGASGLGVEEAGARVDLTQGALRMTDEPLDVALDGDGFFSVATANGVRYTRDGQFRVDAGGRLVTAVGDAVLGTNGRPIVVGADAKPTIAADGTVESGGRTVGRLAVAALTNPAKVDGGFFAGGAAGPARETAVRQGFLEQPNATAAETMVEMIESLRAFEADQRVIHSIDESLQRGIQAGGTGGGS
jgi:flagellar basal-body rod protein FlgG